MEGMQANGGGVSVVVQQQDGQEQSEAAIPYESIRQIDEKRNRELKRRTILAHDVGAGAPCLKCGDKCEGFDLHFWRKICKNCKCPPFDHDIRDDAEFVAKIGRLFDANSDKHTHYTKFRKHDIDMSDMSSSTEQLDTEAPPPQKTSFEWIPAGATNTLARKFMKMMPKEKRPICGTVGAKERVRLMNQQLPSHDQDPVFCDNLTESEAQKLTTFVEQYKSQALGIGIVREQEGDEQKWYCARCEGEMIPGDVAVFAERAGPDTCWHPQCFTCSTCNETLVDLIYFWKEGKIYCGRHYADLFRPRCAACDELIFAREYTQAEDRNWHLKHFCCWHCDTLLGGKRYVAKDNHPFCLECYGRLYARICQTCKEKIPADSKRLNHQDYYWHAVPECFRCNNCNIDLVGKPFLPKQGQIFCSVDCKREVFGFATLPRKR